MRMSEWKLAWAPLEGRGGYEAGRELLGKMYRELTGEEMPSILIAPGGKPYFEQGDLHFSISHTKAHVFCVLSPAPVGLDAEEMDRPINLKLAEKILSPAEKLRYASADDKRSALLKLWVLKEASVKFTGRGLQGYPKDTDFSPEDPRVRQIGGCYVAVLESER